MTEGRRRVLIIGSDRSDSDEIKRHLEEEGDGFIVYTAASSVRALDTIYNDPPDLIILHQSSEAAEWKYLCGRIKADTVFGHLPIILIVQPFAHHLEIDWNSLPVDDYLKKPLDPAEIRSRIPLAFARAVRVGDANPLSRLPGNYSIMKELQACIDSKRLFAAGYVDLDHFKSYNDKYGFLRGDEILKMTARLLTNIIRKLDSPKAFVGHIGGDDFVFIVHPARLDSVCQEVIKNFDMIVGNFYDEDDRIHGYIESTNRKGEKERFPMMSISIAVVTNKYKPLKHIGQVSVIAAEIKKRVKSMPGSCYVEDSRRANNGK